MRWGDYLSLCLLNIFIYNDESKVILKIVSINDFSAPFFNYQLIINMSDNISFSSNRSSIQKFKIVLVGDQNVGKSSIIARYIRNEFDPTKNVDVL